MASFEFADPCSGDFAGDVAGAAAADAASPFMPQPSREDLPTAWGFMDAGGQDFRGALDRRTVAELEASAASGAGVRTLYGAGGPPPPADGAGNGNGGRDGAGSEIMALIGAGFLYAAVDRVLNKDKTDNAQALLFAVLGGGLVYYGRK